MPLLLPFQLAASLLVEQVVGLHVGLWVQGRGHLYLENSYLAVLLCFCLLYNLGLLHERHSSSIITLLHILYSLGIDCEAEHVI